MKVKITDHMVRVAAEAYMRDGQVRVPALRLALDAVAPYFAMQVQIPETIPCAACGGPLAWGERHSVIACTWRAWRYQRKTGLDPVARHLVERTPASQVTVLMNEGRRRHGDAPGDAGGADRA